MRADMKRHQYSSTPLRRKSDHEKKEMPVRTEDQRCSEMGRSGTSSSTALKGSGRATQTCGWDVKALTAQLNVTLTAGFSIEFGSSATARQANTGVTPASTSSVPETSNIPVPPARTARLSPSVGLPEEAGKQAKHAQASDFRTFPLNNNPPGVTGTRSESAINRQQITGGECLFYGAKMGTENRNMEFKRGGGDYLHNSIRAHLRRYACAFLNSGGGCLLAGVDDDGVVLGLRCDHRQEDRARLLVDSTLKGFHPPLLPQTYSLDFLRVVRPGPEGRDLKGLRLSLKPPPGPALIALYQTDQGEVFLRRDGSVEGPLSARAIQEWARQRWSVEKSILQQHVEVLVSQHRLMLLEIQQQREIIADLHTSQTQHHAQTQTQAQTKTQATAQTQTQTQAQTQAQTKTKRSRKARSICICM